MFRTRCSRWAGLLLAGSVIGSHREAGTNVPPASDLASLDQDSFGGSKIGEERDVAGVKLCWCPAGRFIMGSPPDEPERRPGEDQVEVTLTKGFWIGKYEVTQSQWRRVVGEFPGKLSAGEGDDFPVYEVNFAEAEEFCRKLTEHTRATGDLPAGWEFRLPTEAQWEYACRAGTTTAGWGCLQYSKRCGQPANVDL